MDDANLEHCRYCNHNVTKGIRRCPYCGVLNPTLKIKEIVITIAVIFFIMSIVTYIK